MTKTWKVRTLDWQSKAPNPQVDLAGASLKLRNHRSNVHRRSRDPAQSNSHYDRTASAPGKIALASGIQPGSAIISATCHFHSAEIWRAPVSVVAIENEHREILSKPVSGNTGRRKDLGCMAGPATPEAIPPTRSGMSRAFGDHQANIARIYLRIVPLLLMGIDEETAKELACRLEDEA